VGVGATAEPPAQVGWSREATAREEPRHLPNGASSYTRPRAHAPRAGRAEDPVKTGSTAPPTRSSAEGGARASREARARATQGPVRGP